MNILKKLIKTMLILCAIVTIQYGKTYQLYFLGGRSNMVGYGNVNELPQEYKQELKNVMIFEGNSTKDYQAVQGLGIWKNLKPGHGEGIKSDGDTNYYSSKFGVELSFGRKILELSKNKNIAIIRSADGYGFSDKYHYNTNGYIDLGIKCTEAIYQLQNKNNSYNIKKFLKIKLG